MNKNNLITQGDHSHMTDMTVEEIERQQRKAAYALNLCTVSVSQIIDYEDLNILEQEYEMILNNLNLENFPKDDALLHILKQILDTITFFRIYEGDKQMLDKKYQHKMKNAIWSAIPNFTFVASGNPYAIAVSAVSAIGMGYMNYRREKANISLENEEENWKLQRSAIEQFNGLRRELFDTAWRLADTYGFKDEDRLTEKQIAAYNKILMDPVPLRRFERLNAIQHCFNAYPPFWYNLGNAAHEVAKIYENADFSDYPFRLEAISKYRSLAEASFHKYLECDHSLLRTDYIRSSCCLDYAALLLEKNAGGTDEQVRQLISDAEKYASDALDVLQICAIYSLRVNDINNAQRLLRKLVIEGYNTITNAQLLSYVYLTVALKDQNLYDEKTKDYEELVCFADGSMLVPWVKNKGMLSEKGVDKLLTKFLDYHKVRIEKQFKAVVDKIIEKQAIEYNKLLFRPRKDYNFEENKFYTDSNTSKKNREQWYCKLSQNKDEWSIFVNNLRNKSIALVLNEQLNEVCRLLSSLVTQSLKGDLESLASTDVVAKTFQKKDYKEYNRIFKRVTSEKFDINDCKSFLQITFTSIVSSYVQLFENKACLEIGKLKNFQELISIEDELAGFCRAQNYPSPEQLCKDAPTRIIEDKPREFINILAFFDGAKQIKQNVEKDSEIKAIIEEFIKSGKIYKTGANEHRDILFSTHEKDIQERRKILSKKTLGVIDKYGSILAYFHDNKKWYNRFRDLYFLRTGLVLVSEATFAINVCEYYRYDKIQYDNSKNLIHIDGVNSDIYSSDTVNVSALYDLIRDLGIASAKK